MMLSVPPGGQNPKAEPKSPHRPAPLLSQRTAGNGLVPPSPRPGVAGEGLDKWFEDLQKYEATLGAMAQASEDAKFREELGTIEQWFKMLSESEQTATLYTLLQHANQGQVKFLGAVLTQMDGATSAAPDAAKTKQPRSLRPPSLNLPLPGSPATPGFSTPVSAVHDADKYNGKLGATLNQIPESTQEVSVNPKEETSWANMVNTPLVPMFQKGSNAAAAAPQNPALQPGNPAMAQGMPGMGGMPMMNPFNMAMLNNMGFSNEAQILAVQMVMSGLIQPPQVQGQKMPGQRQPNQQKTHSTGTGNWRAPSSAKYPGSALRSAGLKSSGLRSAGLKSGMTLGSATTPKEEDIDPELLKDVPAWLKSLRLHKYTACFDGMTWKEMVVLDEPTLEAKGVAALGARRRLIKTFDLVKVKMGMQPAPTAVEVPVSASIPSTTPSIPTASPEDLIVPHSAAPTF